MLRNTAREIAIHLSYELNFATRDIPEMLDNRLSEESFAALAEECNLYEVLPGAKQMEYIRGLVTGVAMHQGELDGYIEKYAVGWKFSRIPMMAVAIMRIAMYEVMYRQDIPTGVAINEAVEIAKTYGQSASGGFVNAVLAKIAKLDKQA